MFGDFGLNTRKLFRSNNYFFLDISGVLSGVIPFLFSVVSELDAIFESLGLGGSLLPPKYPVIVV